MHAGNDSRHGPARLRAGPALVARPRPQRRVVQRRTPRAELDMSDWNAGTIAEFRAHEGRVGGTFEGAPIVLLHHRGRRSGGEYVTPTMYLPHDTEPDIISSSQPRGEHPPIRTGTTT